MAAFSMRIVVADYYTAKPISPLDYDFSEFRSSPIERVPIIRIFGSTPKGQKACLHIHDVYPYFYVPLPENIADEKNFCLEFASSLDTSLHVALGKAVSSQQYVYSVSVEKKIPFYGYYEGKKKFMKISMYNPNLVSRAGELLISGAVLNQTFQPYETHIPYMLQFLIDYNLSGMNFIHLSNIEFRQPLPPADENSPKNPFQSPLHSPLGSPIFSQINSNIFDTSTVPNFLLLTPDIEKQTTCPLEGDTIARNIKNKDFIQESLGKNPGLALLWEDEKMRRRENNESSFIEMPVSQPRDRYKKTDLEELQLQRLKNLLDENKLQQSGKLDESDATSFNLPPAVVSEHSRDDLSSSVDPSLIDILADMPNDSIVNTPLSETTFINNGLFDEQDGNEVEQEEERESIMMSQKLPKIGDDDDDDRITNNDESTEDEDEESVWTDTFLAQIPQLDGHSDENSSTLQHFDDYTEQPHSKSVSLPTDTSTNKFDSSELTRIPQIDGNYSSESSTDDFQIPSRKKTKKRKSWQRKSSNFIDDELESNSSSTKSENKNSNSDASSVQSSDIYHPLSIEAVQTFSVSPIEGRKMYPTRHSTLNKTTIQKPTSICSKHSRHNEKITKYRKKHGKSPLTFLSQPVLDKKSETKLNRTTSNSSMISPSPRDQKLILETKTDRKSYHEKYQIKQFAIVLKDILKDKSTTGLEKCISDKQKQSQSEDTCSQKENKESLSEIISSENNERGSSLLPKPQLPSPFKYSQQSRRPSLFSGKPMKFILSGKASLKRILDSSSTPNNEDAKRLKSFENVSGNGSATNTINEKISVSPKDPSAPSTFRDVLSSVEKVTLLSPVKNPETPQTIYDSFENSNLILSSQSSNQNKSFCSVKTQDIEKTVRLPTSSSHIKNVNLNKDFVTPISKRLTKKSIDYNIVSLKENFGRQTQAVDCESSEQISKVLPPDQSESKKACSIGDENISNIDNKSLLHEETPSQNLIPQLTVNIQQTSMQGPVDTVSSSDSFHNGQDTNVCMQSDILFSQTNTEAQLLRNINTSQLDYECNTLQNSLSPGNEESQVFDIPASKSLVASQNTTSAETKPKSCFIKPVFDPPTVENVLQSLHKYSMDECKYVAPFYSIEKDAASTSAVHSGQIVAKAANKTKNLPEASTKYSGALSKLQKNQINNMDISLVPDLVISPENLKTSDIKHLLYGEQYINIIPVKQPPSSIEVLAWYEKEKVKESKNKQQKNEAPTKSSKVVKQAKAEIDQSSSTACKKTSRKHVAINPTLSSLLQTIEKETTKERMTEDSTVVSTISPPFRKPAASAVRTLKSMKQKQVNKLTLDMSAIEGMSPNNTYAFKFPSQKMSDVKALHLEQHLTILSIEVHVNTRRDYKPDPSIDSISAIFFYFCKDPSATNLEKTSDAGVFVFGDGLQSSLEKGTLRKQMMYRAGLSNIKCVCFDEEVKMLLDFALFVQNIDPDVIMGYEVQMLSLGYIIERAAVLEINMTHKLSRLIDMYNKVPSKNEKTDENWFGQLVTMSIPGRIILNIWRVMRSEVTLQIYTYENVLYHVLHRRVAKHSYKLLSNLWNENHNRWRVFEYYMERCKGNVELLDQIDFINRTSELARIFGILFYSVISRGSQYRVESMMLRIAKPLDFVPVSPNVHQRAKMAAPECIQLVLEPESKMYVDPVIVLDFQSLYPSIIIAYNYCYSTCLGRVQQFGQNEHFSFGATNLNLPFQTTNELLNNENIHISPNGVGFVTTAVRKGILPRMLEEILNTRLMVKGAMKKAKQDKVLHKMLDSRQLGLKLIANVTYGYTAANFSGRMPCIEIGDSVVRKGRETLERAIELVNTTSKWNAKVVYGDTDSLFVLLKGASKETAFDIAKEIVDEVTALNPKPIKLKFEKVYQPCVLITKKRYVGYMYETRDQKHPVFDAKGIETIRRDNCPAVGKILDKSLRVLFDTKDVSLVKAYVQNQFNKITQGRVTMKDFIFAKEYRGMSSYKPGACVPALMLTRKFLKIDRRAEPRIGERVPYVIVHGNPKLPLIQLVRTPHEVADTPGLRINDIYYITKQICPALGRVFSLLGVNVQQWFAEMPKVSRVQQRELEVDGKRKGTISHYFASSHCPVCESVTTKKLCNECVLKPQETVLSLSFRISTTERRFNNLIKLCQHCTGCQDTDAIKCISLDCPNFFKLSNIKRDMSRLHVTRTIIEEMF